MLALLPLVAVQVRLTSIQGPHLGRNSHEENSKNYKWTQNLFVDFDDLSQMAFFADVFFNIT